MASEPLIGGRGKLDLLYRSIDKVMATLVTALYDLKRGSMERQANNHRPFSHYLEWFRHLLGVNAPLVIYIPPAGHPESGGYNLETFIRDTRRSDWPTRVVVRPLSKLPMWSRRDRIASVMTSRKYPSPNLEFHHPDYIVTIYSKFGLVHEVAQENPFGTDSTFWIDAGYFRQGPDDRLSAPWPDPYKLRRLGSTYFIQNRSLDVDIQPTSTSWSDELLELDRQSNPIVANFFGGVNSCLGEVERGVIDILDRILDAGIINNEQEALTTLIRRHPSMFLLYPHGKDGRRAMVDLSMGGHLAIGYDVCPHLRVVTMASREVNKSDLDMWDSTATYYGYHHEIVGRDLGWTGWADRSRHYLEALYRMKAESIVIGMLTDGTDVFFCGSSWETYDKFIASSERALIGGESRIAYASTGRHNIYQMEAFLVSQCQSRFCFPNGGCLIGYVDDLIQVIEANTTSIDDQAGYMDLMMDRVGNLRVDESTRLIGNLPNHHLYTPHDVDFWMWDQPRRRYYNPLSGEYPVVLHFPGNNRDVQRRMYRSIHDETIGDVDGYKPNWVWWIVVVLVLVTILASFWSWRGHA